ncbi:MAG: hypothetical protein GYB64_08730 [Chloroflexi bacterium]|nr:hypothetical protein [Chloroflexota bacterium]
MPYSQTHLAAALDLLERSALAEAHPWLLEGRAKGAFLLGSIGPDARVVGGISRDATHYYAIPRQTDAPIEEVFFAQCPSLRRADDLSRENAAFVAGYVAHLIMDVAWLETVVMPALFIEGITWEPGHPHWDIYNMLMAYLEVRGSRRLPEDIPDLLEGTDPSRWIPCLPDEVLAEWARHIAHVIPESGPQHVIRLLSRSVSMPYEAFVRTVSDRDRLLEATTPTVHTGHLEAFWRTTDDRSMAAVLDYLSTVEASA